MNTNEQLTHLRHLFYQHQGAALWAQLCRLFDRWQNPNDLAVAVDFAQSYAEQLPDTVRVAPLNWRAQIRAGTFRSYLRLVRTLHLSHESPQIIERLAQAKELSQVTWLDLSYCTLRDVHLAPLETATHFTQLRYLNLQNNQLSDEGLRSLARSPHLGSVQTLLLNHNPLGDDGLLELATSGFTALHTLELNETHFGNAGLDVLASSGLLRAIQRLSIDGLARVRDAQRPSAEGLAAFVKTSLPSLRELSLAHWKLDEHIIFSLFRAPHGALTSLNLCNTGLHTAAIQVLAQSPRLGSVAHLDLSHNRIHLPSLRALSHSPYLDGLTSLNLEGSWLSGHAAEYLAQCSSFASLESLNVKNCGLAPDGFEVQLLLGSEYLSDQVKEGLISLLKIQPEHRLPRRRW